MKVFAISDLHLSFQRPFEIDKPVEVSKPMEVFGRLWENHITRLYQQWHTVVSPEDVVLIPGDISWAMTLEEAVWDLDFIHQLPGRKVLIRGNHDYWWQSLSKVREALPEDIFALQNDALCFDDFAICGTRLWCTPFFTDYSQKDEKIYRREYLRQELSLKSAKGLPVINMNHYIPVGFKGEETPFSGLFGEYNVIHSVYGHFHGKAHQNGFEGLADGTAYHLVSSDYLGHCPKLIGSFTGNAWRC